MIPFQSVPWKQHTNSS